MSNNTKELEHLLQEHFDDEMNKYLAKDFSKIISTRLDAKARAQGKVLLITGLLGISAIGLQLNRFLDFVLAKLDAIRNNSEELSNTLLNVDIISVVVIVLLTIGVLSMTTFGMRDWGKRAKIWVQ